MSRKIPATIITGFLGAGKTSLIRHLLANAGGRRLALVINEFGDLGVDRELLAGCGVEGCTEDDIVELTNGCICCTVADDFLPSITALLARPEPPDHIVIETSGLALPKPLVKAFGWPEVRTRVTVDGVIAVIDAEAVAAGRFAPDTDALAAQRAADPTLDHESPLEELFEEQILCADMVVLNKADRVDATTMERVRAEVAGHLRPLVRTVTSTQGGVDPAVLLGLGAAAEDDLDSRRSHHEEEGDDHDHDEFESFVVPLATVADPAEVEARIRATAAAHDILRVKGFLDVAGKAMRHVIQGVGDRIQGYYDRPWKPGEARQSRLVVIGQRGLDREAISAALAG
ncbi:cobalamin biosynthesis protein CobW [Azospirillum sp. TSO22-1]|uniref:cobalamin biosynthesis protein CobW n=1 Tax=Azospirillum sp. TSO22-1 TaxID=716789 RepID=UPI001FFF0408|nr:cobalamin biosynthesis protein CobW [Azospirillum sp. TSO22-1]